MISHKHKFIFIHINHCGGTSISQSLRNYGVWQPYLCDPDLIKSPLSQVSQHLTAQEFKSSYPKEIWDSYYKFAFVRNPLDRLLTYFLTHTWKLGSTKFEDFILGLKNRNTNFSSTDPSIRMLGTCFRWLCDHDGKPLDIDFIGKLENIEEDFPRVCNDIGVSADLTHENKTPTKTKPRSDYYNINTVKVVEELYREDFVNFNY